MEIESTGPIHDAIPSANTTPHTPTSTGLQRRVFGLAWPVIAENFLETLLGIVDTALVGALGAAALAGVGSAHQILFLLISVLAALSIGCSVLVAQAVGAKDLVRASQLARQSLLWSVVVSIPLAMAGFVFAQPFLSLFNLDPAANEIGLGFTHVTMGTVVVLVALLIGGGVLRGAGDSRTPFMVTAIANVVNVPLAYGLIYGAFGLPQLGAVGSAWATFIARAMALALLVMALWRGRNGVSIRHGLNWRLDLGVIRQVLTIGVPAAIEQVLATLSFTALTILVGTLGTATLAAHRLIITVTSFSFLPGFGFAIAATALIGQAVGAKRFFEIKPIARVAAAWAAMWMGAIGLLLILFAPQALSFFTKDQAVIDSGSMALRLLGIAQAFWGIQFVHNGAMRGMGDTRSPLVVAAGGLWFTVGVAWVLLKIFDGGLTSIWGAFPLTTPLMMLICLWRFNEVLRRFVR